MKRLAFLALLSAFLALPASAQIPNSKVVTGNKYRLNIEFNGVLVDSMIRFPKASTLSNNLINEVAGNQGNRTAVQWVHAALITGSSDQTIIFYSPAFPAGADTTKVNGSVRTFSFGGCTIDSMKYINPGTTQNLQIYCTDGDG